MVTQLLTEARATNSVQRAALAATGERCRFRARLIAPGRPRTVLDEPADLEITAAVLQRAVADGLFENLACFVDHAAPGAGPSLRNLLGVWSEAAWDAAAPAVTAVLTTYDTEATRPLIAILQQLTADQAAGAATPDVGVSLVFYPEFQPGTRQLARIRKVESADLVFYPAADGRILQALSALKQFMEDKQMTDQDRTAGHEKTAVAPPVAGEFADMQALSAAWLGSLRQAGTRAILDESGLPEVVKTRLARQVYETPQEVQQAVRAAHEELQALDHEETVDLGARPRIFVTDPQDRIQAHMDWFFGVPDTPPPPPNYRRLDQLYVALTGDAEFYGVYRPERVMLASADTSTLAGMAVSAMNKVVQAQMAHLQFWRWYELVAYPVPNDGSVQDVNLITFGGVANLPTVAEGAAYSELTVDDVRETESFVKKGGYVGITLEMIRNSSILEIQAVPKALAIAAVRTRSAAVSGIFTSNSGVGPTLDQDSKALFHADHNNVATTALGTDATAWRAARVECFGHTEVNSGKVLGVFPKFLLVPDDLYDTALSITGYGEGMPTSYTPEAQARNAADPRPVVVVVPDWTDANDWAYVVDPQIYPVIQISYAQAPGGGVHPAPELYSVTDESQGLLFTNDVMPIKVRDWFAVGVNGPRGIGKRNVA